MTTSAAARGVGPGPVRSGRRRGAPGARRQAIAAWTLAIPFLALFLAFTAWPLLQSVFLSFTDATRRDLASPFAVDFVGLDNFVEAFGDERFLRAIVNTLGFVVVGVPLTLMVALAAAVALDRGIGRLRAIFRLGFYTPVITSIVAVAVVWRFILHPDHGLANTVLAWVGIDGPNWLGSTTWAMPSLVAMAVWRNFGTAMIIFLAGLQTVPASLREAAELDGANGWQRFRSITLPLLRPTILFVSVTTMIGYLQFFEEPFVMTDGGGPLDSTLSVALYTYEQFSFGEFGFASAVSYVMFAAIAAITAIQFRLLREKD
ncbi:carbohydrate ABC transporter permease [Agrococcus jejuensis]|uniref:Carbohydrate ABC transporter membrane protein 1, CUT1 family n=1 Tax=Agrococcus jejuensis TaxID=399736 RepID=A0A1G8BDF1_9MICO|nr:sugar ABC transporter permease [Agrococcus jejuensis]SDH31272.1 carbohydrate ABC transporter membrane protein 1, CUT1 family [Agrococcus jejuensis]